MLTRLSNLLKLDNNLGVIVQDIVLQEDLLFISHAKELPQLWMFCHLLKANTMQMHLFEVKEHPVVHLSPFGLMVPHYFFR